MQNKSQSFCKPLSRLHSVNGRFLPPSALLVDLANVAPDAPATTQQVVYIGLGSALVSFFLTFGVAPRFRGAFKEEDNWRDIYGELVAMGRVESLSPTEAAARAKSGYANRPLA
jgi:hypothetical protein